MFPYFGDREFYLVGGCLHHAPHTGLVGQTDGGTGGVFKHRDKTLGQGRLAVTQFSPDLDLYFLKNPSEPNISFCEILTDLSINMPNLLIGVI